MYKHNFVAGDEVVPIEIKLNAASRISSIDVHDHCNYYICTQRFRLKKNPADCLYHLFVIKSRL